MPRVIHKYTLPLILDKRLEVPMPKNARILSAHWQGADIQVWAQHDCEDTASMQHARSFVILATGKESYSGTGEFYGTVFDPRGFVWHVFQHVYEPPHSMG